MKTILVPFDGSESSLRAVAYAATVARENPTIRLALLHVIDPTTFRSEASAQSPDDLSRLCPVEAERVLAPAKALLEHAGITPVIRCRVGAPAAQIADEVNEGGCGAVIMGTRGMRPLASLMIGSVASGVVSLVNVPVTLIK